MKRSDALRSLSREHHQALSVGRDLRRADDPERAATRFLDFWDREGAFHFRIEEEVLLPCWELLGRVDAEGAARLAKEHRELRAAALEVAADGASLSSLHALGEKLTGHVRFEERELFPMIEGDLDTVGLERLARAVADAEAQADRP